MKILALDVCECHFTVFSAVNPSPAIMTWDGEKFVTGDGECPDCGHVCRVVELDLGEDPEEMLRISGVLLGIYSVDVESSVETTPEQLKGEVQGHANRIEYRGRVLQAAAAALRWEKPDA